LKRVWFGIIFLLFVRSISVGQTQNICLSACDILSGEKIPYCNVVWGNNSIISNDKGAFCISKNNKKSELLLISNIAYQPIKIVIDTTFFDSIIYLVPKQYKIPEVTVNWSDYKFKTFGNKAKRPDYYYNLWRFCHTGLVLPPLKKGTGIIEEISVPIFNPNSVKVPFRLHIYSIDSLGGVGKELLPENVFGQLGNSEKQIVKINVLRYQIKVPDNGYIVTVELLSNKKPDELLLKGKRYYEKQNNQIGFTKGKFKNRKLKKVSAWKPNSFYVESYPFTNVEGMVGDLPLIKVKVRKTIFQRY